MKEKDVQPIRSREKIEDMKWALRRHSKERDYIFFLIGINTGLRAGDLVKLKTAVFRNKRRIELKEGKTKKQRIVTIGQQIYEEVQAYIQSLDSEWLFPSQKGSHITVTQAYRQLQKAADWAGIESIGTHTMRKTFGYFFYKQTKNIAQLMVIFNHSNQETTLRYIGVTQAEIEESLENFSL